MPVTGMAILYSVATLFGMIAQEDQGALFPIPSPAVRAKLEREVRALFREDYVDRSPEGRRALATKLLLQADLSGTRADERYAFLCEAREVATLVPDLETALAAVNGIANRFDIVNGLKTTRTRLTLDVLCRIRRTTRTLPGMQSLAQAYHDTARRAVRVGDFDVATSGTTDLPGKAADQAGNQNVGSEKLQPSVHSESISSRSLRNR